MSDAQDSTTIIPYRTGVRPLQWDFPQAKPPRPHSRDAYFTNPDLRLRPREPMIGPQLYFTQEPKKLAVNQWNFPEINAEFLRIRGALGLHEYKLYIIPDYSDGAVVRYRDKEVLIGANYLNRMSFDSVHWLLGHELGHAWRHKNPEAPQLRSRRPLSRPGHAGESEADIVSLCMNGDQDIIMRGMKVLQRQTDGEHHPSRENRIASIRQTSLFECLAMEPHMPTPSSRIPYRTVAPANKKARD